MAYSSGNFLSNSSGSSLQRQNNGSDVHQLMDQRKQRRMESNRESARRSRMRKQKHLDDLVTQITELKNDNNQIQTSIDFTTQHYMTIEAENSVLRAQMMELSQRLDSLNQILDYIDSPTKYNGVNETEAIEFGSDCIFNSPFNLPYYLNHQQQPITASPDIFQY